MSNPKIRLLAAVAAATVSAGATIPIPDILKFSQARLHEQTKKNTRTGEQYVSGYRLGLTLDDSNELCLTIPIVKLPASTNEKMSEHWHPYTPVVDNRGKRRYTVSIWTGRELKAGGKAGRMILSAVPADNFIDRIVDAVRCLKDEEAFKEAVENGLVSKTARPIDFFDGEGEKIRDILCLPLSSIPHDEREITQLVTIDQKDGSIKLDAKRDAYCFGQSPIGRQIQGQTVWQGGRIDPNSNDTLPADLVALWQKTLDAGYAAAKAAYVKEFGKEPSVTKQNKPSTGMQNFMESLGVTPATPQTTTQERTAGAPVGAAAGDVAFEDEEPQAS